MPVFGATKDLRQRMVNYKILNYVPSTQISYFIVDKTISDSLKQIIFKYYSETPVEKWNPYLRQQSIDNCVASELQSIEYKVERILIEEYRHRQGGLPPGNPRRGSNREFVQGIQVLETSSLKVMELKPCIPNPITLNREQILELLK